MLHKRLINAVPESKKWVWVVVLLNWISLLCNIIISVIIAFVINALYMQTLDKKSVITMSLIFIGMLIIRQICTRIATYASYRASTEVKHRLRGLLYQKLTELKLQYQKVISSAEVTQIGSEGIEQLDIYFGQYLPQFFYSMLAPLTLFFVLVPFNFFAALTLLLCVPLIPLSIVIVQKIAKRLLKRYFGIYSKLGDNFLDSLQGLITLKIYGSDDYVQNELNEEAEHFRKVTMRVLTMQLNSVSIMDLFAYGGASLGIIVALVQMQQGNMSLFAGVLFILLSAEFFLPLRLLGSFFHIAMNGITAANRLFAFLDTDRDVTQLTDIIEDVAPLAKRNTDFTLTIEDLAFQYSDKPLLKDISLNFSQNGLYGIVGESGSGKSTLAALLLGLEKDYRGTISLNAIDLKTVSDTARVKYLHLIGSSSYLFEGTVRENLLLAKPSASDSELEAVLKKVQLFDFIHNSGGLSYHIESEGKNLSGGQVQRLALARSLLFDAPISIFDEATSNIDVESEEIIMQNIKDLSQSKIIILISHRLANMLYADSVAVLKDGVIIETGSHTELLAQNGVYAHMFNSQSELEKIREVAV